MILFHCLIYVVLLIFLLSFYFVLNLLLGTAGKVILLLQACIKLPNKLLIVFPISLHIILNNVTFSVLY